MIQLADAADVLEYSRAQLGSGVLVPMDTRELKRV